MKATVHMVRACRTRISLLATLLHSLLHRRGRDMASAGAFPPAPWLHRHWAVIASLVGAAACLALGASSAFAAGPPYLHEFGASDVHATRSVLEAGLQGNGSETSWKFEYATSKSALESGLGIAAQSGFIGPGLGAPSQPGERSPYGEIGHLDPETRYYARVIVANAFGSAEETTAFTTTAVKAPEVGSIESLTEVENTSATVFLTSREPLAGDSNIRGVETNGLQSEYRFEYATEEKGAYALIPGCSGLVTVAEDFANPKCHLEGLMPEETRYYVRLAATNAKGSEQTLIFPITTPARRPNPVDSPTITDVTADSAFLTSGNFSPRGSETTWRCEYASSEDGPWGAVPGGEGVISSAEANEKKVIHIPTLKLSGLSPGTSYYVRLFAENAFGKEISSPNVFETAGPPAVSTFATHALQGESVRVLGSASPHTTPVDELQSVSVGGGASGGTFTLSFAGQTTAPIPFGATADQVQEVLEALSSIGHEQVFVLPSGAAYTIQFLGSLAGEPQPQLSADASSLTPSGSISVTTLQEGFHYDTHYRFQFVSQQKFSETGWAGVEETPSTDLGPGEAGYPSSFFGAELPTLQAGSTYRYRVVATTDLPGNPVVDGAEETLTAPSPPAPQAPVVCENEALRSGPSANLPDCRAYEQVTPHDKEGAQEPFHLGTLQSAGGAWVGADGEHLVIQEPFTHWGTGPSAGASPYLFSRGSSGWQMTSLAPQPEAGDAVYSAQALSPDLTEVGLRSEIDGVGALPYIEYKVGPPGGPYSAFSVPRPAPGTPGEVGWVGVSENGAKLVLQSEDHALAAGHPTGTTSGFDLYEYSEGHLRQVNVAGAGTAIGSCGARIVHGDEDGNSAAKATLGSPHAVSADGARVFFEAVPGTDCSASSHLFMREAASEHTLDIGAYRFLAADSTGSKVLLEKHNGGTYEILLYETETQASPRLLLSLHKEPQFVVSEDFTAIYLTSSEQLTPGAPNAPVLYRYDIPTETLSFILEGKWNGLYSSPDGRYLYFSGRVGGFPAGGTLPPGAENESGGAAEGEEAEQALRYDNVEKLVQCISCASSFDPKPKLNAFFSGGGEISLRGESGPGLPEVSVASADGDVAFFDTPAALVPQDVDGEILPEGGYGGASTTFSPSSDVYEWRRGGTGGCARLEGCLSLISSGRGGKLVAFLGTTPSARDVFFTSAAELGPNDDDDALDVYDARVGGGEALLPPGPVECEGDACSTPASPPNDVTPSSLTFSGAGNVTPSPATKSAVRSAKPKKKKRRSSKRKGSKTRSRTRPTTHKGGKRTTHKGDKR